ncbi:hypothetical protein Nepgr_019883 [Nepenthes gracilis]|uniref:Senescence domain-containing protein n=1 Tax=Nepenthes gracilis TaxID=150966 RepID=A0AAD3XUI7_NEPGR|nr:hypothetical protein Nepgr_019883 [Nepenthes gracilis]
MKCCGFGSSKHSSAHIEEDGENFVQEESHVKHEPLIQIPGCTVHLMDEGEAVEIARGDFTLFRVSDETLSLATIIKAGEDLQWPLTKDEPVVKLDSLHYLFTLPIKDGDPLNYGVAFSEQYSERLASLDSFLQERSCFSCPSPDSLARRKNKSDIDWKVNAYTNQVQKWGEMILTTAAEERNGIPAEETESSQGTAAKKKSALNQSLKRVRKLSKMTEKMSKAMLDGVGVATGSVTGPLVRSKAGKKFFAMMPGEVLLASLDAVDKVLNAAEAAEKQALRATSGAAVRMVSNRFGESAGEATDDALATAGHVAGTAWNVFKIRKTLNPASSVSSGVLKTARRAGES